MTFREDKRLAHVAQYLAHAEDNMASARVLLDTGHYGNAISRAYYAVLDAAMACLVQKDLVPKSHEGTLALFNLHYIKTGLVEARMSTVLRRIRKERSEADYRPMRVFHQSEAEDDYRQAAEFVAMAKTLTGGG